MNFLSWFPFFLSQKWVTEAATLDVLEAIKGRRSVRNFRDKEVSKSKLEKIIECGTLAPSAGNLQPWEFVVVRDSQRKRALAAAALHQNFVAEGSVVIVVLANESRSARIYGRRGAELYSIQDTAAAIQNMLLAAHGMGLGACWVGAFDEDAVAEVVGARNHVRPVGIIAIGYPRYIPEPTSRRKVTEVIHEEMY